MKIGLIERNKENKKPTRYYSKKQETNISKKFNGKRQPNSGATKFKKGDVALDNVLIECKTKTSKSDSIKINKEWIIKNKSEALFMGKDYSVIAFNFGPNEENYYIINEDLMEILLGKL